MAPYLCVLAVALIARVVLSGVPLAYVNAGQALLWSWPMFAALAASTLAGAFLAVQAGIPSPLDPAIRNSRRFLAPIAWGSVIAGPIVFSDVVAPVAAARGVPTMHVPFPASVPFYVYGAILIGVLFHFLPLSAAGALALRLPPRARRWAGAAAVLALSFSEDGGYFARHGLSATAETFRHVVSVAANLTELLFIWNFGLLAGLSQRLATYTWWHIVWGGLEA